MYVHTLLHSNHLIHSDRIKVVTNRFLSVFMWLIEFYIKFGIGVKAKVGKQGLRILRPSALSAGQVGSEPQWDLAGWYLTG